MQAIRRMFIWFGLVPQQQSQSGQSVSQSVQSQADSRRLWTGRPCGADSAGASVPPAPVRPQVIVFSFSKRECEALSGHMGSLDLTNDDEKRLTQGIWSNAIECLSHEDQKLGQARVGCFAVRSAHTLIPEHSLGIQSASTRHRHLWAPPGTHCASVGSPRHSSQECGCL